jgi:hypothetical protein
MKDKGTENTLSFTLITCMAAANKQENAYIQGRRFREKSEGEGPSPHEKKRLNCTATTCKGSHV